MQLSNGRVLVMGGGGDAQSPTTAEVFDPVAQTWSDIAPMSDGHSLGQGLDAQLLGDGRVLLLGDKRDPQAGEIYDPVANTWTLTGLQHVAHNQAATAGLQAGLQDGRVLVAGGTDAAGAMTPTAEVFSAPMTSTSGATYYSLTPARILDSRVGNGLSGPFASGTARTFGVTGQGGVPANATAVTGNLTVTGQTALGYIFLGPVAQDNPTSSTLNFPLGNSCANGVTVALGAGGTLSATYASIPGATASVIFDVSGYFTP